MKICDKCKKELPSTPDFMQTPSPYFLIYRYENGINIEVSLCASCCKKFNKWLKEESYHCVYNKDCTYRVKEL